MSRVLRQYQCAREICLSLVCYVHSGVGKTTVSRLVAKLYHQLGVSSKDKVVEVQKGDLVAGCVRAMHAPTQAPM